MQSAVFWEKSQTLTKIAQESKVQGIVKLAMNVVSNNKILL